MNPPRVLIVMAAQWHRALIRAALRNAGYDAVGTVDLAEALSHPTEEERRGPVGVVILDRDALPGADDSPVAQLLQKHPGSVPLLLESAFHPSVEGSWPHVLKHPVRIADIVATTQRLLPLPAPVAHPLD
jgi:CheY-like chemotaxis protein